MHAVKEYGRRTSCNYNWGGLFDALDEGCINSAPVYSTVVLFEEMQISWMLMDTPMVTQWVPPIS